MKKKLIILQTLLMIFTINCATKQIKSKPVHPINTPKWVPDKYKKNFKIMEKAAYRMAYILRSEAKLKCQVKDGGVVFEIIRHDFTTKLRTVIKGVTSCEATKTEIILETIEQPPGFRKCFTQSAIGFGAGYLAGMGTCAVLK